MRVLFRALFFFSFLSFFLGLIVFAIGATGAVHDSSGPLQFGLLLMLPLVAVIILKSYLSKGYKRRFEELVESNGGAKYADFVDLSGIAITNAGKIVLCNLSNLKAYALDDVRSYKWATYEPGIGGRKQLATIAQEQRQQDDGTGLFLSLKDISNPTWHVRFKKKPLIDKWFEILNQIYGN